MSTITFVDQTTVVPASWLNDVDALVYDPETANYFYAGPTTGAAARPTFRAIVAADITSALASSNLLTALGTQAANKILAGPTTGTDATPTFRSLVIADMPSGVVDYVWLAYSIFGPTETITAGSLDIDYPPAFTLLAAYLSCTTASGTGAITMDMKEAGTTMLNADLSIAQNGNTSSTITSFADTSFADKAKLSINVTGAGVGAAGLVLHIKVRWA